MNSAEIKSNLVDSYLKLLDSLSTGNKLELIAKLSMSIKAETKVNKKLFKKSFGAFQSDETAEELISKLRNDRLFTRQIESF